MASWARSSSPGPARSPSPGSARPCSADSSPFKSGDCCSYRNGGACSCHPSRRSSFGEKENDAARTPKARHGSVKNFMAPTISASSKVVVASASPKKKVLGERNEQHQPFHSSPGVLVQKAMGPRVSFDGERSEQHQPVPSSPGDLAQKAKGLRLSFDGPPAPPARPREVSRSDSWHSSVGGEEEARMEDPVCKDNDRAAPSADAAYDPKTNYLSPRPRFLRYKPNPRIQLYRNDDSSFRRLEEGFASESSEESDAAATMEDELTEEEQEPVTPVAAPSEGRDQTCVLLPEPAPGSPLPFPLTPEAAASPRPRALTPEPRATSPPARAPTPEPELGVSSAAKRKRSLRFLLGPLALVLFMVAALVCVPPVLDSQSLSNTSLSKVSDFLSVQELHPVELPAWLKQWSSSSLDLITSYWEALASTQEQGFFGPHFAANMSASPADSYYDADFYYNFAESWPMTNEEPVGAIDLDQELKIQDDVSANSAELTAEIEMPKVDDSATEEELIGNARGESLMEEANEYDSGLVVEELKVETSEEASGSNGENMASFSQNLDIPFQSAGELEHIENLEGSESSLQEDVEIAELMDDKPNGEVNQEEYHGLKSELSTQTYYSDKISPVALGVALAAVMVSTALAFLYTRQRQAQVARNANAPAEPAEQAEPTSASGSSEGHLLVKSGDGKSFVSDKNEKLDVSQYSSSMTSGDGRRRKVKGGESPSLEPTSKRESISYSTSSYGSFTTYENIPAKKRNKEDEATTPVPVRRSSRLLNVKSP